jgi:hypothetical protein
VSNFGRIDVSLLTHSPPHDATLLMRIQISRRDFEGDTNKLTKIHSSSMLSQVFGSYFAIYKLHSNGNNSKIFEMGVDGKRTSMLRLQFSFVQTESHNRIL